MNFNFKLLIITIAFIENTVSNIEKRIIGGEEAPPDKYRWAVSIKGNVDVLKTSGACGASIINTGENVYWLVTAAHCFYPTDRNVVYNLTNPKNWHARVGLTKVDFEYKKHGYIDKIKDSMKSVFNKAFKKLFGKKKFKTAIDDLHIKKIIIHPGFQPSSDKNDDAVIRMDNDIALMKLKDALPIRELEGVNTINLPDPNVNISWPEIGSDCIVVGWGCTAVNKGVNPIAKLAILKIWEFKACETSIPSLMFMNPQSDFCAGYLKKTYGLCHGDSGSGLICDYKGRAVIAGVVSRGHGRDPGEYPAVFTRVSSFTNWIRETVMIN